MTAAEMREAAAKAALKFRPTGENAKAFVETLVLDIAEAIRALPADPAPLTTADAARVLLAKWNSWWCGEHATKEASHE